MREGMIAEGEEAECGFTGNLHAKKLKQYSDAGCGSVITRSQTQRAAGEVLDGMRNEVAQDGKDAFCRESEDDYRKQLTELAENPAPSGETVSNGESRVAAVATCTPETTFHLERLQANTSLKVVALGETGIVNVQRFLNLTMQNPVEISQIPRVKVWVAWDYVTQSLGGSPPGQGVIDIVQDGCVLYRRQGAATEIYAIANGDWSR